MRVVNALMVAFRAREWEPAAYPRMRVRPPMACGAVARYVVGEDIGGEYEYGAVLAIEDLKGYWEYLTAPSHAHTDRIGLPLVEKFVSYDTTDSDDPEIAEKIAELHARRYSGNPALAKLVADLPSYSGSSALAGQPG